MHIHILGICGTFMGGLALIARAAGHTVTGCDTGVYPPMSTQLEEQGIDLTEGFGAEQLALQPDLFVIGNVVSRGNPLMEAILDRGLPYTSGPQWLGENILQGQHVLAVAGTHGKTTTSSMLAWILTQAGLKPNFLIGGIAPGLKVSAHYDPASSIFVIEADEYDTAFFDKRSKFVHYRPRTVVLNNLEFDHADIFSDLAAIETQFHHLVRMIPSNGLIIRPTNAPALDRVLAKGCWSPVQTFGSDGSWRYSTGSQTTHFIPSFQGASYAPVCWNITGEHNRMNALAALAAAHHANVSIEQAVDALNSFSGVKRRMEVRGVVNDITVYDDFAHHPTAIATTLDGLRRKVGDGKILAVIEPRSNTMRMGSHKEALAASTGAADEVIWYQPPGLDWSLDPVVSESPVPASVSNDIDDIIARVVARKGKPLSVVVMSNGGFGGIHQKLLDALQA
ncbi:MAG TPA: UDP-N-acetylmuramate:L-alanyl-gamma-D-glutamyl-meso-diaminopimelate ligase [Pusillimonas sp.]|nr:UDP-N-acetylmuramate:L-alanyl-gamma-D-glutamyl-meso-diaminopimelate ligase [Pusillimonas sp.]